MSRPSLATVEKLVAEDRAHILRAIETKGYETAFERFWVGIEKDQLDACKLALVERTSVKNKNPSTSIEDPMASGDIKKGQWVGGPVEERRQEDGTYILVQTLFRGNVVISAFVVERSCSLLVERTLYFKAPNKPEIPAPPYDRGISYRMSELLVDGALGTFTGWIDKRTSLTQLFGHTSGRSQLDETYTRVQNNITDPSNLPTLGRVQGYLYRQSVQINPDCSLDARTDQTYAYDEVVRFDNQRTLFRVGTELIYKNWRTPITAPATGGSGLYRANNQFNQDGTYDATLIYECGTNAGQVLFPSLRTGLQAEDSAIYRDRNAQIDAPVSGQGGLYRADNQLTPDGLYNASLAYQTSTEDAVYFQSQSPSLSQEARGVYRNRRIPIIAPESTPGGIYNATQRENADKTYDAELVYQLALEDAVYFSTENTAFRRESAAVYRNRRNPVTAPIPSAGGLYRVSQRENADKTYDAELTYRASANAGEALFSSERAGLSIEDSAIYRDRASQIQAPASGQAGIYRASNQLTDDGLYNAGLQYQVSQFDAAYFRSTRSPFRLESTALYRNSRSVIEAPESSTGVYRVNQRENNDKTYDAELTYTTSAGSGAVVFASERSPLVDESSAIYRSQTAPTAAPVAGQAGTYVARNNLGDDGLYDSTLAYQLSISRRADTAATRSPFRASDEMIYRNSRTPISAPATTIGLYRANGNINRDGTYDGTLTYDCPIGNGVAAHSSRRAALSVDDTILYRSMPAVVPAPASVQGAIYDANNQLQEDGTYDARLLYRVDKPYETEFDAERSATRIRRTHLYRNSPTAITAPASGPGGVYRADNNIAESGVYDATLSYLATTGGITAPFVSGVDAKNHDTTYLYVRRVAQIDTPNRVRGAIYDATNRFNEDDSTYDAQLRVSREDETAINFIQTNGARNIAHLYRKTGLTDMPAIPSAAGGVYEMTADLSRSGLYDATLIYRSGKVAGLNKTFRSDERLVYVYSRWSQPDTSEADTLLAGNASWRKTFSPQLGNDGLYDFTVTLTQDDADGSGGSTELSDPGRYRSQVYLVTKRGDFAFLFSKVFTRNKTRADQFMRGIEANIYGTSPAGTRLTSNVDGFVTDTRFDRAGRGRWIATRVDLYI